jgi:hypothetical protein
MVSPKPYKEDTVRKEEGEEGEGGGRRKGD